ncbi:MAG: aminotransferase class V-fold PLP-dependent enzyme [bacterium]
MTIDGIITDEAVRRHEFPVTAAGIFMAHAGVAVLPRVAADGIREFADRSSRSDQENEWAVARINQTRSLAARLLGCDASEIALLGPTALGLNLVANGLSWQAGDEVVFYLDDYPANVYPWLTLASRGVKPVLLRPSHPGVITWDLIEGALTERTRLVALASCHFASGFLDEWLDPGHIDCVQRFSPGGGYNDHEPAVCIDTRVGGGRFDGRGGFVHDRQGPHVAWLFRQAHGGEQHEGGLPGVFWQD